MVLSHTAAEVMVIWTPETTGVLAADPSGPPQPLLNGREPSRFVYDLAALLGLYVEME